MASLHELTTAQLKQAVKLRKQVESLQHKLNALLGGSKSRTATKKTMGRPAGKRTMSAATKKKMAAGQKARWAKVKAEPLAVSKVAQKKKGGMTPEGKAKIAAAMKARWASKKKDAAEQF